MPETAESQENNLLRSSYDPLAVETLVSEGWKSINIREKIKERFVGKKGFGYVDGPPTLNGEPHIGHLRGRIIKDLWYRFETMQGTNIDFRGGWDCQGLPVELQAEKELGLTGNKTSNLKKIGEETLVAACKRTLEKYYSVWREADQRVGLLINDEKAYWTYRDSYIEREWQILRSAWINEILAEGYRVTPFCPSCQTSLSAAEVALGGYQKLEDPSMYFKMKVSNEKDLFLIVWTTMPFTVITDELVGVKPDSQYCHVSIQRGNGRETWVVGEKRLESLMKELHVEDYSVVKKLEGKELEGLRYEHPLSQEIPKQSELHARNPIVHTVASEDFVDDTTGSGLVHMSPANGEDDFEVSRKRNVPIFNPIDGQAVFTSDAGEFAGLFVRDSDQKVAEALKQNGSLLRYGKIRHEYPVCWRSNDRLVWLARREYFYFVDRLNEMAVDAARNVEFYYEQPRNRFIEIVKEKRPWCISRERVWGTPLPIWRCEKCDKKIGLFSRKEISDRAQSLPDGPNFELHRPWIDRVVIKCPDCENKMNREPFVLDTWHNSGAAPFASHTDKEYQEYIPVPFLTEGIDQTRGWAYSLLIENVILKMKSEAPYRAFLFQGHLLDEKGEKLSKSKGNFIPVRELLNQNSIDLIRFYLIWKAGPIDSLNFSKSEMLTRAYQILNTLYHMHVFYLQNSSFDHFRFVPEQSLRMEDTELKVLEKQDRWLLSRLGFLIDVCTSSFLQARYHEAARAVEKFLIDELSQTYIPIVRSEMLEESDENKKRRDSIYAVLATALYNCDLLLQPMIPHLTDHLAKNCFSVETLILRDWPESKPEYRNEKLELEFDILAKVVSVTNAARMKAKVKRRWPLRQAYYLLGEEAKHLLSSNRELLLEQTNLSNVHLTTDPKDMPVRVTAKLNFETVAPRAKAQTNLLAAKLAEVDATLLFKEVFARGKTHLPAMEAFELSQSDLIFKFESSDPRCIVIENFGIVIALDFSRDDELIAQGIVRDIARNLQALRKSKGFNPTDVLNEARISGLDTQSISLIEPKKEELAFLVRVKLVDLRSGRIPEDVSWQSAEIDGMKLMLEIS